MLKSSDESSSPKEDNKTLSNDIDKKEEDKLLQIDDAQEIKTASNDLKEENKLLELDNEDSNHSVTSVKSSHSINSNHSVKSNESIKSNHSAKSGNSIKSVHSIHLEDSSHLTKNPTTSLLSDSRSQSPNNEDKELNILNHNECSNHSVKSCTSQQGVKSNSSIPIGSNLNSVDCENNSQYISDDLDNDSSNISSKSYLKKDNTYSTSKLDRNSEKSNDSVKCSESIGLCNKAVPEEAVDVDLSERTLVDKDSKSDSIKAVEGETSQSESPKSEEDKDVAKDDEVLENSQKRDQDEIMHLDSDREKADKPCKEPSSESKDEKDIEQCSNKTQSCDSGPQSIQSEISAICDEDNEKAASKPDASDRKRPADEDDLSSEPKRSRLDEVIGQLENRTGISLNRVKSIEELSDTDTSHLDSEMTESKSEDTTSASEMDDEDEESSVTPVQSPRKTRRMSQKVRIINFERCTPSCVISQNRKKSITRLNCRLQDIHFKHGENLSSLVKE